VTRVSNRRAVADHSAHTIARNLAGSMSATAAMMQQRAQGALAMQCAPVHGLLPPTILHRAWRGGHCHEHHPVSQRCVFAALRAVAASVRGPSHPRGAPRPVRPVARAKQGRRCMHGVREACSNTAIVAVRVYMVQAAPQAPCCVCGCKHVFSSRQGRAAAPQRPACAPGALWVVPEQARAHCGMRGRLCCCRRAQNSGMVVVVASIIQQWPRAASCHHAVAAFIIANAWVAGVARRAR
jgi:hypothetical protein